MTVLDRSLLILRGVPVVATPGLPLSGAAQFVVTNANDAGAGSLRDATTAMP